MKGLLIMGKFQNLVGQTFGRLTVIERVENNKAGRVCWKCRCTCGNEVIVTGHDLKNGDTKSCSCLNKEKISERSLKNLVGMTFGRLTVIERAGSDKHKNALWRCRCTCGNEIFVVSQKLLSGHTQSCNCLNREINSKRLTKHGKSSTKIYRTWCGIKNRCFDSTCEHYDCYGGRGVTIYDEWLDFQNFYDYVSQLEHFEEPGYSLDRIDNNGNYAPGNIRWANQKTQQRNKRTNRIVEYEGVEMSLAEAAEKSGIKYNTLCNRLRHGDKGDKLFRPTRPVHSRN